MEERMLVGTAVAKVPGYITLGNVDRSSVRRHEVDQIRHAEAQISRLVSFTAHEAWDPSP